MKQTFDGLPGVVLYDAYIPIDEADQLFDRLLQCVNWEQHSISMYGKDIPLPRKEAWYSPFSYTYSGMRLKPQPIPRILQDLIDKMTDLTGCDYNGVLLNLYSDGRSSIGMHADDEVEFGENPTIASLSLGSTRLFKLQRKDKTGSTFQIPLSHGSVLVMSGDMQTYWKHGIDKIKLPVGPRINLTFRNIVNPQ